MTTLNPETIAAILKSDASRTSGNWVYALSQAVGYSHEITDKDGTHGGWAEYTNIARLPGKNGNEDNAQFIALSSQAPDQIRALLEALSGAAEALEEHDRVGREYHMDSYDQSSIQGMTEEALTTLAPIRELLKTMGK